MQQEYILAMNVSANHGCAESLRIFMFSVHLYLFQCLNVTSKTFSLKVSRGLVRCILNLEPQLKMSPIQTSKCPDVFSEYLVS